MAVLLPNGKQFYTTNAGLPLVGGKIETYDTGTNNPRQTTSDAAGLVPNANPVILDARGEATIFWNGAYRVVVRDSLNNIVVPAIDGISTALAIVGSLIPPVDNTFNLGSLTFSWANLFLGAAHAPALNTVSGNIGYWARTAGEISAGVTPTDFSYPPFDVRRYGAIGDGNSVNQTTNSTAIQNAINSAYAAGGGIVFFPPGTFCVNAVPLVWNTVSIQGSGRFATFIKKTTATASTVTDNTVRRWDSVVVGFPVCCLHFVHHDTVNNWADGYVSDICCLADTTSPNTTTTIYGFFFRGMSGAVVTRTYVNFCQQGYFWGQGATFASEVSQNQASNTQRGFYQQFATSTPYFCNYANKFRFAGHYTSSYYSLLFGNAADNAGSTWKVGTAEISQAYELNGFKGGSFVGNGCETHNGSVWKFTTCIATRFENNFALDITSNYTGGSDVVLLETNSNNCCEYYNNRAQTTSVTGTPARHFIYKIATELGSYKWGDDNLFVANFGDTTNTSTWVNISGTIQQLYEEGTFTVTLTGCTAVITGTAVWVRYRNIVNLYIPTLTGVSNSVAATLTGLPASIQAVRQQRTLIRIQDNSVVGQGTAIIEAAGGIVTLSKGDTEAVFTNVNNKSIFFVSLTYNMK